MAFSLRQVKFLKAAMQRLGPAIGKGKKVAGAAKAGLGRAARSEYMPLAVGAVGLGAGVAGMARLRKKNPEAFKKIVNEWHEDNKRQAEHEYRQRRMNRRYQR